MGLHKYKNLITLSIRLLLGSSADKNQIILCFRFVPTSKFKMLCRSVYIVVSIYILAYGFI